MTVIAILQRVICGWVIALPIAVTGAQAQPAPVTDLSDGRTGMIRYESLTPPGFFALVRREAKQKATVTGMLAFSDKTNRRVPAMVISHGSGGVQGREERWASALRSIGVATFVVDSFTPRGITSTAADQTQLSNAANLADALAALRLLTTHPRIDPARIGIIGFSRGAQVALFGALEPYRRSVIEGDIRFAAHVALYPFCNDRHVADGVTGAPLLILLGGRDNYTPPQPCRDYGEWFKGKGTPVTVTTYANSYHAFDTGQPAARAPNVVTGRNCSSVSDLDRFTVVTSKGEDVTSDPRGYYRSCAIRGAMFGGDAEARRKAPQDVRSFLTSVFKL